MYRHIILGLALICGVGPHSTENPATHFTRVQEELFNLPNGQSSAWADYDNDGDLDIFVTFRETPSRLYENDDGVFRDVAADVGLDPTIANFRSIAWGDFNGDGHMDIYVSEAANTDIKNRLYRNDGDGDHFTNVAAELGLDISANMRQASWVDYDNDGDVDLYLSIRDDTNRLMRNDGDHFTDVSKQTRVDDRGRTVGSVWFDFDEDGDLDLFTANQSGDPDGLFRNDKTKTGRVFTNVALEKGVIGVGYRNEEGSVGTAVTDFDNDGDLDLFVATYGENYLYRNDGGKFTDVAEAMGLTGNYHAVSADWGDYDNDGRQDLYIVGYVNGVLNQQDFLYHHDGDRFTDQMSDRMQEKDSDHSVRWADYDGDGDLDLALTTNQSEVGFHQIYRNDIDNGQSLRVSVENASGAHVLPGAEVRLYDARTDAIISSRLVDTGGGYNSQNAKPVFFGLDDMDLVDVEVTTMSDDGRRVVRIRNIDPNHYHGTVFTVEIQ